MKKALFFFLFILIKNASFSQRPNKYWLEFTDKNSTPFSVWRPAEFLSPEAISRRKLAGIAVDETDLPVDPAFLNSLKINGLRVHAVSKWLNGAAVIADSNQIKIARNLPFVKKIEYVGPHILPKNPPFRRVRKWNENAPKIGFEKTPSPAGYSTAQLDLLGLLFLQKIGKSGAGISVAVMDGGFINVDTLPFFATGFRENRIFQARDFVENDGSVFEQASHGTAVLSVMASEIPSFFMGSAPKSTYFLMKTEDTGGEFPIEEINWIAGAELADSLGCGILNASLGYTEFNDKKLGHHYPELDGRTTLAARAAKIGAKKGMIICNSAGNEGDGSWHFIGTPADAEGVIAVGAVTFEAKKAVFSSFGPTADGRVKPDLAAPGQMVVAAGTAGYQLTQQNGTSLASPLLAGALASLWSDFPEKTAVEILEAAFRSANQTDRPDNNLGWGMPDFLLAYLILADFPIENKPKNEFSGRFFDSKSMLLKYFGAPEVVDEIEKIEIIDLISGEKMPAAEF